MLSLCPFPHPFAVCSVSRGKEGKGQIYELNVTAKKIAEREGGRESKKEEIAVIGKRKG